MEFGWLCPNWPNRGRSRPSLGRLDRWQPHSARDRPLLAHNPTTLALYRPFGEQFRSLRVAARAAGGILADISGVLIRAARAPRAHLFVSFVYFSETGSRTELGRIVHSQPQPGSRVPRACCACEVARVCAGRVRGFSGNPAVAPLVSRHVFRQSPGRGPVASLVSRLLSRRRPGLCPGLGPGVSAYVPDGLPVGVAAVRKCPCLRRHVSRSLKACDVRRKSSPPHSGARCVGAHVMVHG